MKSLIYKILFAFLSVVAVVGCTRKDLDYEYEDPRVNFVLPESIKVDLIQETSTVSTATGRLELSNFKAAKGDVTVTRVGFCYSLEPNPTVETDRFFEDRHYIVLAGNGATDNDEFFVYDPETGNVRGKYPFNTNDYAINWTIENLEPCQKYHCRTFIENIVGIVYGPDDFLVQTSDTVTMSWRVKAEIVTDNAPVITPNSVTVLVGFTFIEPATVESLSEFGVCYGTSANPTIDDAHVKGTLVDETSYSASALELEHSTDCYIRPYVICEDKVIYGEPVEYTTLDAAIETDITYSCSHAEDIDTKISLKIENMNFSEVSEYGLCYSESQNPTIDDTRIKGHGVSGNSSSFLQKEYSLTIQGLTRGTTLYMRPYVITEKGNVVYGNMIQKGTVYLEVTGSVQTDFEQSETGFEVRGEIQCYEGSDGSPIPYPYRFTYRVDLEFKNIEDAEETGWESTFIVNGLERKSQIPTDELRNGIHQEFMWQYSTVNHSSVSMRAYAKMKDGTYITGELLNVRDLVSDLNKTAILNEPFIRIEKMH